MNKININEKSNSNQKNPDFIKSVSVLPGVCVCELLYDSIFYLW